MRPWQHAKASAGADRDWLADLPIHEFIDSTKLACPHVRHRMILHNCDLGPELAARAFPDRPDARDIALQHIAEDFKTAPSLADWLALCDSARLPKPSENGLSFETLPSSYARSQEMKEEDGPRAVLDLLLLPVALAGPGALSVLFNAVGPAMVRRVLGPPRLVPSIRGGETMFEPGHAAEKMIQSVYGNIPTLVDVVGAVKELPLMIKESA